MSKIPLQVTYDTVVEHLRKQGCKAYDKSAPVLSCVYRTIDGRKCAAGCLIPDSLYQEEFEGMPVTIFTDNGIEEASLAGECIASLGHDLKLVRKLQRIHDNDQEDNWESMWEAVAKDCELTYTPPVPA